MHRVPGRQAAQVGADRQVPCPQQPFLFPDLGLWLLQALALKSHSEKVQIAFWLVLSKADIRLGRTVSTVCLVDKNKQKPSFKCPEPVQEGW